VTRPRLAPAVLVAGTSSQVEITIRRVTTVSFARPDPRALAVASVQQELARDGQHQQSSQSRALGSRVEARQETKFWTSLASFMVMPLRLQTQRT